MTKTDRLDTIQIACAREGDVAPLIADLHYCFGGRIARVGESHQILMGTQRKWVAMVWLRPVQRAVADEDINYEEPI